MAKQKKPRKTHRRSPHPDELRDMLRRQHRLLMTIGGDYETIPGKPRWQALQMAHEIAETLRRIGNGVDHKLPPKPEP